MASSGPEIRRNDHGKAMDFEQVYRRYFRSLYAFVAYRVGDRDTAEDITSLVFEKALKAYASYDPEQSAVSTWLFTIARNAVSDHFRAFNRLQHAELNERTAASSLADPESELEAVERRRELTAAMAGLDAREQDLLALKFGAALNNREIAGLMGMSESNVGTTLYRSLNRLKTMLEGGIDND